MKKTSGTTEVQLLLLLSVRQKEKKQLIVRVCSRDCTCGLFGYFPV